MTIDAVLAAARRLLGTHRRLLAAALAAAAVGVALPVLAPAAPPTQAMLVAAHDIAPGASLGADDVTTAQLPPTAVPDGALRERGTVVGRTVAGAVRAGEVLTDVRLVGPALLSAGNQHGPTLVATPVRIADPGAVALLRAGDVVDVLAATTAAGARARGTGAAPTTAAVVANGVRVLSVPTEAARAPLANGALVVLGTTAPVAAKLAAAAVTARLSVVLRAG